MSAIHFDPGHLSGFLRRCSNERRENHQHEGLAKTTPTHGGHDIRNAGDTSQAGEARARKRAQGQDLARLQEQIEQSDLGGAEKARLSSFVRNSAPLVVEADWPEYITRMEQLINLKAALVREMRVAEVLGDAARQLSADGDDWLNDINLEGLPIDPDA